MEQHPRSNGTSTAVVARAASPAESQWDSPATADDDELCRAAVLGIKSKKPFGYTVPPGRLDQLAAALSIGCQRVFVWSFYVAAARYEGGGDWKARKDAMAFLENDCGMPKSNARRACDTVDIVHRLTIEDDPDGVGVPTVHQLNRIARADMKKVEGGVGIVNGWVVEKWGHWDKVTPDALADYCKRVKDDALGVAADKKALQTAEDPHDPPEAEVVEEVDGVPVASTPSKAAQTKEWRAESRKFKALAEIDELTEMAGRVANLDEIPDGDEELLKRIGDIERLADLAARLRAKATPIGDELPL